jgi:hypothetical protein
LEKRVLFVGDDWAEDHHDVEVQDGSGRKLEAVRLPEGVEGVAKLHALLGRLGDEGLDAEKGARRLVEALGAVVLGETDDTRYVFRHVLAQQVAYRHIPGPRRARLHRRAIAELEARTPVPLVQIAHHTLAAGDREGWFRRVEQAVDQAIELGDVGTAAGLLHRILDEPHLDGDLRSRAALALARIAVNGADHTRNAAVLRRILADPQLSATTRGEIRLALGLLMVNHAGDRTGYGELERCVGELEAEGPTGRRGPWSR